MTDDRCPKTYEEILQRTTLIGSLVAFLFQFLFTLSYLFTGFMLAMWVNLIAGLIALVALFLMLRDVKLQKISGHLIVFSTYCSILFTSIIMSSPIATTLSWFTFVIVLGTLINSLTGGILWGVVSTITVIALIIQRSYLTGVIQPLYEIADNVLLMVSVGIAMGINEYTKRNAMHRAEALQDEMRHLATIDDLTKTYNRRHFYEYMRRAITKTRETKQTLSLVLFDLDHFKQINDRYGHMIGDQVLTEVVSRCQQNIRDCDVLWRFGGEEFIILMPNTSGSIARKIANRLCTEIEREPVYTEAGSIPVTISLGVASLPEGDNSIDTVLHHVDEAMYAAKQAGRNQVIQWDS